MSPPKSASPPRVTTLPATPSLDEDADTTTSPP